VFVEPGIPWQVHKEPGGGFGVAPRSLGQERCDRGPRWGRGPGGGPL